MTNVTLERPRPARPLPYRPRRANSAGRHPALCAKGTGPRPNRVPTIGADRAATRLRSFVANRTIGLALLVAVAVASVFVSAANVPAAAGSDATPVTNGIASAPEHLVLAEGETVWELVTPHRPEGTDMQTWVRQVIDVNGFDATAVPPGTVVQLP